MRAGFAGLTGTIAQSRAVEPVFSVQPPRRFTSAPLGAPAGRLHQRYSLNAFPHGLLEWYKKALVLSTLNHDRSLIFGNWRTYTSRPMS